MTIRLIPVRRADGSVLPTFAAAMALLFASSAQAAVRTDAAGDTAILARELEQVSAQSYDVLRDPKVGRTLVPFNSSVAEGAETYSYDTFDGYGTAEFVTDYGANPPRSDVFKKRTSAGMHTIWQSYAFTIDEMAAAAFANVPLDRMRAQNARTAIEQKIDDLIAVGDSVRGIQGLANNSNIPSVASVRTNPWLVGATALEIFTDLNALVQAPEQASAGNFVADTLVLPLSVKPLLARPYSETDTRSILTVWLSTQGNVSGVTGVVFWKRLNDASALGGPRALAFKKSNQVFEFLLSYDYREEPPQVKNLETQVIVRARVGGLSIHYAYAMAKMDLDTEV